MSALLIKDQNSEENSKTYLTMLSLTIPRLQGIIPKLMALQKGWFRHARRDFEKFVSLGTKRIRTWPYLTSPWVTRCPNMPLCLISLLTFYFLGDIHSTLFHCCSNGPGCGLGLPNHWAKVITERDALIKRVMPMAMENLSIAQHRDTL
jgi:hypothetical protein